MPAQSPPDPAMRSDLLTRAKAILDVSLAGATLLYALGYSAWAVYAWDMKLGVPPLLHSQYLVAGVIPAVILLSIFVILRALRGLRVKLKGEPGEKAKRVGAALKNLAGVLLIIGWLLEYVVRSKVPSLVLVGPGLALFLIGIVIAPMDRGDRWFAAGASWYLSVSVTLLAVVLFFLYVARLFPRIPPELGGPSPQCVTLDVDAHQLSRYTLDRLVAAAPTRHDSLALHTKPLFLILQGDSYVLAPVDTTIRGRAFRLKEEVVVAVFPDTSCVALRGLHDER